MTKPLFLLGVLLVLAGLAGVGVGATAYMRHSEIGATASEDLKKATDERKRRMYELDVQEAKDYQKKAMLIAGGGTAALLAGAVFIVTSRRRSASRS